MFLQQCQHVEDQQSPRVSSRLNASCLSEDRSDSGPGAHAAAARSARSSKKVFERLVSVGSARHTPKHEEPA